MGSSRSKVAPVLSEDKIEEESSCPTELEIGGTSCWAGIKKLFSRNTKVVPLASESDAACDDDEDDNDDDADLVQTSNNASTAAAVEPKKLHRHAPKRRRVRRERPSTSYPADLRVSTGYFLYYHRFVNDDRDEESSDEESSDEEEDECVFDADVESDADEERNAANRRFTRRRRRVHSCQKGKSGAAKKKSKGGNAKNSGKVSSDNGTSRVTHQRKMVKNVRLVKKTNEETAEGSSSYLGNDVTSEDRKTSHDDDGFFNEVDVALFMGSLSWITHISVVFAFLGVFVNITWIVENEKDSDVNEEAVVDGDGKEAVVNTRQTGDRISPGHQKDDVYESDFETDSETDIDQPSTSYKRDKHAIYDFLVQKRFMDVSSDEYIW